MRINNDIESLKAAAYQVELVYVKDNIPGISRKKRGKGFIYYSPEKTCITNSDIIQRINNLAIPPAYKNVWICPLENGHLQATGIDDLKRKQYRYHEKWLQIRDQTKFEKIKHFGEALPKIRKKIAQDIENRRIISRDAVLAAMVTILDRAHIRVGNDIYAQRHNTFGLTTLRKKHSTIDGTHILLDFEGKNGTEWHINLQDRKLAKIIRKCEQISGYRLFKYIDEKGEKRNIDSGDINNYLYEITGENFTAKDFRTWATCYMIFSELVNNPALETKRQKQMQYNSIVKNIAKELGHTPAICKKSYISPTLCEAWELKELPQKIYKSRKLGLSDEEYSFLSWWTK